MKADIQHGRSILKCEMHNELWNLMSTENAIPWQICANIFLNCVLSALSLKYSQTPNLAEKISRVTIPKEITKYCAVPDDNSEKVFD